MTVAPPKDGLSGRVTDDDELFYPSGDGKPMAENDVCRLQAIYCMDTLRFRYRQHADVYVAGDNFVYYEQGNRKAVVSPDVYVAFGVPKGVRKSYRIWRENGIPPTVVIEITSASTRNEDIAKRSLYERLGVAEYFQLDPSGDYLAPRLQGLRLVAGRYTPISPDTMPAIHAVSSRPPIAEPHPSTDHAPTSLYLRSERLGLYLAVEGDWMRFYDAETGAPLLGMDELATALPSAELRAQAEAQEAMMQRQRADAEAQARVQLEAELARLRVELEAVRRQQNT